MKKFNKKFINPRLIWKQNLRKKKNTKLTNDNLSKPRLLKEDTNFTINTNNIDEQIKNRDVSTINLTEFTDQSAFNLLKYWVNTVYSQLLHNTISSNINYMDQDKVQFFINFIGQTENKSDECIKIKYAMCCILINILADTDYFNNIFISNIEKIYNCTNSLLIKENLGNEGMLTVIVHLNWLIYNILIDKDAFNSILKNENINIPQLIFNLFIFNSEIKNLDVFQTSLWILNIFLAHCPTDTFFQYKDLLDYVILYLKNCFYNFNIEAIIDCFLAIDSFTKSKEICLYLLQGKDKEFILECLNTCYIADKLCRSSLKQILMNDENNYITKKYEMFQNLIIKNLQIYKYNLNELNTQRNLRNKNESFSEMEFKFICDILDLFVTMIESSTNENRIKYFNVLFDDCVILDKILGLNQLGNIEYKKIFSSLFLQVFEYGNNQQKNSLINKKIHILSMKELKLLLEAKSREDNQKKHHSKRLINVIENYLYILTYLLEFGEKMSPASNCILEEINPEELIYVLDIALNVDEVEIANLAQNIKEKYLHFDDEYYFNDE